MDLVTIAFLALIVLVGGGIALFADWLGRKLGKKRLRLGRLRPRHTAAMGVMSSGVIISIVTIGLMYGLSSDVREWIREGRRALILRDRAIAELNGSRRANAELTLRNSTLSAAARTNEAQIDRAKGQLASLRTQQKALLQQSKELTQRLDKARRQYDTTLASLDEAGKRLTALRSQYKSLDWSYKALYENNKELSSHNEWLVRENEKMQKQNDSLKEANAALLLINDGYVKTAQDLKDQITQLSAAVDAKTLTLSQMQVEASRQTVLLEDMGAKINQAQRQLEALAEQSRHLETLVDNSRTRPEIFSRNEELARLCVPAHLSPEQAQGCISSLIRSAREIAQQRGAKSLRKDVPVAGIFAREDLKTHRTILPDEIVGRLVKQIAGHPEDQVLVATSSLNAFQNEPVSLDVSAYPNPLVYKGGQVIAETGIDGASDRVKIFGKLTNFLKGKVRDRVRNDHLLQYADDSFGQVGIDQILALLDRVRAMDRPIRLLAVASADTRRGDPLKIDFRIR